MVEVTFHEEAASRGISGSGPPACGKAGYIFLLSLLLQKALSVRCTRMCIYLRACCGCSNGEPSEHCTHTDACVRDIEADFFSRSLSGWNWKVSRRWAEETKRRCWKDFGSAYKHSAVSRPVSTPKRGFVPKLLFIPQGR